MNNRRQIIKPAPLPTGQSMSFMTTSAPYPWPQWLSIINPPNQKPKKFIRILETQFTPPPQIVELVPSGTPATVVSNTGNLDPAMLPDPPGLRMSIVRFDRLVFPGANVLTGADAGNPVRIDFYVKAAAHGASVDKIMIHPAIMVGSTPYWAPSKGLKHVVLGSGQDSFVIEDVRPSDFVAISGTQRPDLSCNSPGYRLGLRIQSLTNQATLEFLFLDDIDIRAALGCCPTPSPSPNLRGLGVQGRDPRAQSPLPAGNLPSPRSKVCCDDDAIPMVVDGQTFRPNFIIGGSSYPFDKQVGPQAQYYEYESPVKDLFPDFEPTEEWYSQKQPCEPAIGGIDPTDLLDAKSRNFLKTGEDGGDLPEIDTQIIKKFIDEVQKNLKDEWPTTPIVDPYTVPQNVWVPQSNSEVNYAFEGADIVYVSGWDMKALGKRLLQVNWKKSYKWVNAPLGAPASSYNPDYYNPNGYFMNVSLDKWHGGRGSSTKDMSDGHIDVFLRKGWRTAVTNTPIGNKGIPIGYANRCLVVSYNIAAPAAENAQAILRQVADAMIYGTNVLDPLNTPVVVNGKSNFGSRGLVFISQSTGAPLTNIALCKAQTDPTLGAGYIPAMTKLHIANQGAFRGSKIAEKTIVGAYALEEAGLSAAGATIASWLNQAPLLADLGLISAIGKWLADKVNNVRPSTIMMKSTLFDLMPSIAVGKWKPLISEAKFPTYCVVASHPSMLAPVKWAWLPGFDDGVLSADSQAARSFAMDSDPTTNLIASLLLGPLPEPSGINVGVPALRLLAFDLGIAWPASGTVTIQTIPPFNVRLGPNGSNVPSPKITIGVNGGRGQILRALGYMMDHADGGFQSNPITWFLSQQRLSTGMTRAFTHTGMLLNHFDWIPLPASGRRQFSDNYFLGIGSTSDHFKGTNGEFPLLPLTPPLYKMTLGLEKNDEETFIMSNKAKLESAYRPKMLMGITLPGEAKWPVDAPIALAKNFPVTEVTRELKVGPLPLNPLKPWGKWGMKTVFRRRYHLLDGWRNNMHFDYVYGGLLRRP
ncbi:hypothetical protein [Armatimonas sp.]|uniref:hypothetical protein n=1 Tax=Armatimonas sp. TaxID=1872638 RepID=UPI00374D8E82